MSRRYPMRYTDEPPRSNRYNSTYDDDSISIDIARTVPQLETTSKNIKETENLSDRDYFVVHDLFKRDRDNFFKKNELEDDATQKFRENTFKVIDDLPAEVASKYGDVLTDLINKFVQEHLRLKTAYNQLLKTKDNSASKKREDEQQLLISKLTEKLQGYKTRCNQFDREVVRKDALIDDLEEEIRSLKIAALNKKGSEVEIDSKPEPEFKESNDNDESYSVLIEELKTGMSKIELEEELRIKRELQHKEYKLLKQQLEDLQEERGRKNKQVLNRDLDKFKEELKAELGAILKDSHNMDVNDAERAPVTPPSKLTKISLEQRTKQSPQHNDEELFLRFQELMQHELKLNNQELQEKFEELLQNKVSRDELESLLFRSQLPRKDHSKKSMPIFDSSAKFSDDCKFCVRNGTRSHKESLQNEVEEMNERLRLIANEISRLENNEELDETELMRLMTERHSIRQELKGKKHQLDHFVLEELHNHNNNNNNNNNNDLDESSGEQPQESDNCHHTINILRENAQKFGIPLRKSPVY